MAGQTVNLMRPEIGETELVAIVSIGKSAASLLIAMMRVPGASMGAGRAAHALATLFGAIGGGIGMRTPLMFGVIAIVAPFVAFTKFANRERQ